jgi:hypothetical protein
MSHHGDCQSEYVRRQHRDRSTWRGLADAAPAQLDRPDCIQCQLPQLVRSDRVTDLLDVLGRGYR